MEYRSLRNWKYELLVSEAAEVQISETVETEYLTLSDEFLLVKAHYAWDGPSGPTFDRSENMRASLFHDALCQLIGEGLLDKKYREYADKLFRQHCLEDGMKPWVAWCYYQAVRVYSKFKGM